MCSPLKVSDIMGAAIWVHKVLPDQQTFLEFQVDFFEQSLSKITHFKLSTQLDATHYGFSRLETWNKECILVHSHVTLTSNCQLGR